MARLIIEPKKTPEGAIEYTLIYHEKKSDNSFTITITNEMDELLSRLRETLEAEAAAMLQKK